MSWSLADANAAYNLPHWSEHYFSIESGKLSVKAEPGDAAVALTDIVKAARHNGLNTPLLLRFPAILNNRVNRLCNAFDTAIEQYGYGGEYTPVYPIKVNQQGTVVETIAAHSRTGLEAGSKPELLAVLGLASDNATIVCNGYKDRQYIRLALIGQQMGYRVYIVIEQPAELDLVLEEAAKLQLQPRLGIRIRLATMGSGNWQNTGGEKSKFGLTVNELLIAVEKLRLANKLDTLQMLHFHLGSQLAALEDIRAGLNEASRVLVGLNELGAKVNCVDTGGGLGVDYEGTHSESFCSMNYSVEQYAATLVECLHNACLQSGIAPPNIITEAGRAMTAHHALLITDVVEVERAPTDATKPPPLEAPAVMHELWDCLQSETNLQTATTLVAQAQREFSHGKLTLAQRAQAERHYAAILQKLSTEDSSNTALQEKLADKLFINLSVFQSLPDIWALKQIFPIMPIQRLNEAPTQQAVLQDLTCDSDGRIDQFAANGTVQNTLPVHPIADGERYYLAIGLVGAYQEIIGDIHNLFGDTHALNVELSNGGFELSHAEPADSAGELLSYVHCSPDALRERYQTLLAQHSGALAEQHYSELAAGLSAHTYFNVDEGAHVE